MAKRKIVTEEQRARIAHDYESGKILVREIAQKYDVSVQTVINVARSAGLIRTVQMTGEQEKEAVRLYRSGVASPEIAERLGFTPVGIRNALRRHGVEIIPGKMKRAFDEADEKKFVALTKEVGVAEASSRMGVSMQGGYKILERLGVAVKPPTERDRRNDKSQRKFR